MNTPSRLNIERLLDRSIGALGTAVFAIALMSADVALVIIILAEFAGFKPLF